MKSIKGNSYTVTTTNCKDNIDEIYRKLPNSLVVEGKLPFADCYLKSTLEMMDNENLLSIIYKPTRYQINTVKLSGMTIIGINTKHSKNYVYKNLRISDYIVANASYYHDPTIILIYKQPK